MRLQIANFPRRLDLEERLAIGGALGFGSSSIGVLNGEVDQYLETHSVEDLKRAFARNKIALANVWPGPLYEHDGDLWVRKLREVKPRLDVIAELGGRQAAINTPICWPKQPDDHDWDWLVGKYREYADLLTQYGLELVLEYLGPHLAAPIRGSTAVYPFVDNLNRALELVGRIGRQNVGLIVDVMHWWAGGSTYEELHKVKGLPLALHLFDIRKGAVRETAHDRDDRVLPGEGVIDLVRFLRILKQDGFDGDVQPELIAPEELLEADSWEGPKKIRDLYFRIMEQA